LEAVDATDRFSAKCNKSSIPSASVSFEKEGKNGKFSGKRAFHSHQKAE
jgi:hypothetical protein